MKLRVLSCRSDASSPKSHERSVARVASRRAPSTRSPRGRHRGQALLMAVLLMVFAALLGSTFITVVALNLSQTARGESKRDAELAAQAGVQITNNELTNSPEGENWRPEQIAPPPAPRTDAFNEYYSPFEQAQGWTRTARARQVDDYNLDGDTNDADEWAYLEDQKRTDGHRVFVKIPDPRLPQPRTKTPTYLAEVFPITNPTDPQYGMLRVTVIGRSDENDAAFSRSVVYKGTSVGGSPLSFARYDSNYDTQRNKLRVTTLTGVPGTASIPLGNPPVVTAVSTLPISPGDGDMFSRGQAIVISAGTASGSAREAAVIHDLTSSTLTLTRSLPPNTYARGAQVRAASSLMTYLTAFDANGNNSTTEAHDTSLREEGGTSAFKVKDSRRGMYFGGGVALGTAGGLFQLGTEDRVLVAGQSALESPSAPINNVGLRAAPAAAEVAFPPSGATRTGVQLQVKDDVSAIADGEEEGVRVMAPPRLAGQNGKYSRYEELTKLADPSNGSQYGYGPGIHIDNGEDIEKVRDTTTPPSPPSPATLPMPIRTMHRYWKNQTQTPLDAPYAFVPGSVEARNLRGWIVDNNQFVPRGALIELRGNEIVITRDNAVDQPLLANGNPDASRPELQDPDRKAWKTPTGASLAGLTGANTYRMVINMATGERRVGAPGFEQEVTGTVNKPFNGVIHADGNVRVRGWVDGASNSVTIASMGNIYIEGNLLEQNNAHIALLAKKNVVLNPTQFVPHPVGWQVPMIAQLPVTLSTAVDATTVSVSTATINTAENLNVGDQFQFVPPTGAADPTWRTVTDINTTATTGTSITFTPPVATGGGVFPANTSLGRLVDPGLSPVGATGVQAYNIGGNRQGAFVRDVRFDNAPVAGASLVWRQGAQLLTAFNFKNTGPGTRAFHVKKNTTMSTPEVISGSLPNEKDFAAANATANGGSPTILDLLDVRDNGGNPTSNTLRDVSDRFTWRTDLHDSNDDDVFDLGEDYNQDWNLLLPGEAEPVIGSSYSPPFTPSAVAGLPAHRIASVGPTVGADVDVAPNSAYQVPLTVSARGGWRLNNVGLEGFLNPTATATGPMLFHIGSSFDGSGSEELATVRDTYYQSVTSAAAGTYIFAPLPLAVQSLPATGANPQNSHLFAYRPDYGNPSTALPAYYVTAPKLERDTWTAGAYDPVEINVQATVFAEEGSWFIIPTLLNIAPVNTADPAQVAAATAETTRFRRFNYRVIFNGSIAQNMTPTALQDYDGLSGAMARWTDAMSYPSTLGDLSGNPIGDDWVSVHYDWQPVDIPASRKLYLPVSPELAYTG